MSPAQVRPDAPAGGGLPGRADGHTAGGLPARGSRRPSGRRTKQRQLVLEVVQASDDHPTAAQIYQRARRRYPGIAYATIYNTLRWLSEHGEIRTFAFGDQAARFDRNRDRHDHAICTRCGALLDLQVRLPKRILDEVSRRTGLRVASHHVQFLGLCRRCWLAPGQGRRTPAAPMAD